MQKSIEDCYFFYYSTCKNESCPYRHCEKALGREVVCKNWLLKQCYDMNCPNRHMAITKNRSQIPCYWESTPSGCQKPHCPFFHRTNTLQKDEPTSQTSAAPTPKPDESIITTQPLANETKQEIQTQCVVSPVIVQMNEEDDDDDTSNDTTKIQPNLNTKKPLIPSLRKGEKKIISLKKTDKEIDKQPELKVEVKSLEEIRKEKALKMQQKEIQEKKLDTEKEEKPEKRIVIIESDKDEQPVKRLKPLTKQKSLIDESKKDKNIMNIITNTLNENIVQLNEVKTTVQIARIEPQPQLVPQAQESSIKIKTLDEIKAEKRAKLEQQQRELEKQKQQERADSPTQSRKLKIIKPKVDIPIEKHEEIDLNVPSVINKNKENNKRKQMSDVTGQIKKIKSKDDNITNQSQESSKPQMIAEPIQSIIDNSANNNLAEENLKATNVSSQTKKLSNGKFDEIDNELETLMMLCNDEDNL